jgi:hypothetical protein
MLANLMLFFDRSLTTLTTALLMNRLDVVVRCYKPFFDNHRATFDQFLLANFTAIHNNDSMFWWYKEGSSFSFCYLKFQTMLILITGPYRKGTNDDPALMENNLTRLEEVALSLFRAGHVPVTGEWVALPLMRAGGSRKPGDEVYDEIAYPIIKELLRKCDAVLRLKGEPENENRDMQIAEELGLKVYNKLEDIPASAHRSNFTIL